MPKSIVEDYIDYYVHYYKKYGENTCVLIHSGFFYELYSCLNPTDDLIDITKGPNLNTISNLLNIICTRRDKSKEISLTNCYLVGFPTVSAPKFIKILINNGYTVIIVDQITSPPNPKRAVTNIYSLSTYIENLSTESNFTLCVYIEEINKNLCIGLSAADISTGKNYVYESYSKSDDNKIALDEAIGFITSLSPKEILIYNLSNLTKDFIINYMELDKTYHHYYTAIDDKYTKVNYQNELFKIAYKKFNNMISPIENLDLAKCIFATISLVALLDFLIDHNNKLIVDLNKPEIYTNNKHLILGNNAVYQLNVEKSKADGKYKSLISILNVASTPMGKRFVNDRLLMPLTDKQELEDIYNKAELLIKDNKWKQLECILNSIEDIERAQRRIQLKIIHPYEMYNFIKSCEATLELLSVCTDIYTLKKKYCKKLNKLIKFCNKTFLLEKLKLYTLNDIKESLFNINIYKDIDILNNDISNGHNIINELKSALEKIVLTKVNIKRTDRDGYFLQLTKLKANILKQKLETLEFIEAGSHKLYTNQITFDNSTKNNSKIYFPFLKETSTEINKSKDDLIELVKSKFLDICSVVSKKYANMITNICKLIAHVDYYKSIAKTACMYNYTRPIIDERNFSYVKCKQLRHPIVERIIAHEYVPHDIDLGSDLKGMLIYGLNSSGKSILMKALGLGVIMVQGGFFVPATEFIYSPYNKIYTRISSSDNLFKGLSSFVVEMIELNAIQKRSDKNTLVIGDEIARGTENISANSIVAAAIIKLAQVNASFMFATHLHEIMDLDIIKNIVTVKPFHLSVTHDVTHDVLIYDRQLKEGSGSRVYGVDVARYIIDSKEFIESANDIKQKLLQTEHSIIPDKVSKYNSGVYVHACQICGHVPTVNEIRLDVHHINFQKDCINGFVENKQHLQKNSKANLIVLCKKCHQNVHADNIKIKGYLMTSNGVCAINDADKL